MWAEVIAGTFGTVRIAGPFSARITVEALVPLKRPTFVVLHDGVVETLHRPATLGGKGTLGIEARFF